jgi:epoxyqueuosine reductase
MADFPTSLNHSIENKLEAFKDDFGLSQIKFGALRAPLTIEFYEKWISQDYQGTMSYLKEHLPFKKNPQILNSQITSVISVAQSYFPAVEPPPVDVPARVALYSQNQDYHYWLKEKLKKIIEKLQVEFPNAVFLPFVDSGPILERDMAYQNGLGWFGKNTCLIHPEKGSLFFIAEILTDLPTEHRFEPLPDFCGKCQKCIEICPTGALESPKILNASTCISYLTIESKEAPPLELRKKIGDWFFGCDLCQTTCPWNEKIFRLQKIEISDLTSTALNLELSPQKRNELVRYFKFLLTASNKQIQKFHFGSPLSRAGAKGLKRNALVVIANKNLYELKSEIKNLKTSEWTELAEWTLQQLEDQKT